RHPDWKMVRRATAVAAQVPRPVPVQRVAVGRRIIRGAGVCLNRPD
nr:hypothetical protein [Tanacetum cinerariifolium]